MYGRLGFDWINLKLCLEKWMLDNSLGNVLNDRNLSLYYTVLAIKPYDAEIRIEKQTHITKK